MSSGPRVLHVIKGLGPGGAERLLVSVAGAAPDLVTEVAFVSSNKRHLVDDLEGLGVPTHLIGGEHGLRDPRWPARLVHLTGTVGADLVHMHSPAIAAVARPLLRARRRDVALLSTEHNVWSSHRFPTRWANGLTLPLQAHTIAVSEEVVRSAWPRHRRRMEVVLHGVDVGALRAYATRRDDARAGLGVAGDEVVVVTVANLRRQKAYPVLFRAAKLALASHPGLRFVAIGQGPLEADLRRELAGLGLADRFRLLGYHPDPPAVLAAADLFVLASEQEGLPIALLEAMAVGIAPVATAAGGVREVVIDGVNGTVVPVGDPAALAEAIASLAHDPLRRAALAQAAAERALAFDIRLTAATLRSRYEQLAGR